MGWVRWYTEYTLQVVQISSVGWVCIQWSFKIAYNCYLFAYYHPTNIIWNVAKKFWTKISVNLNPHPRMRGPCGPQKTSPGAYAVIIGIPEPRIYLIVHYTEPLYCTTKFFHSGIPMSHKVLHYATAALGSMRTPLTVAGDSRTMEWCLQF